MKLRDNDTQKNLLSDAVTRLIVGLWKEEIYAIVSKEKLAERQQKDTSIKLLANIIERAQDVLLEGQVEQRVVTGKDGKQETKEFTNSMLKQGFLNYLKAVSIHLGYTDSPLDPASYYQRSAIYSFGSRLREVCQAERAALFSEDVQWDRLTPSSEGLKGDKIPQMGPLPSRAEVLDFLQPKLLKITSALRYICTQNNVVEKMSYIQDICEEVFTPDEDLSKIPDLILEIMDEHKEPKNQQEELRKAILAFHVDVNPNVAGSDETKRVIAEKFEGLRMLYTNLYGVNEQLKQKGYTKEDLSHATEDFKKITKLQNSSSNPFKEPTKIDEALTHVVGRDDKRHFDIAKVTYHVATSLKNDPAFLSTYRESKITYFAKLVETIDFRTAFLNKVKEGQSRA